MRCRIVLALCAVGAGGFQLPRAAPRARAPTARRVAEPLEAEAPAPPALVLEAPAPAPTFAEAPAPTPFTIAGFALPEAAAVPGCGNAGDVDDEECVGGCGAYRC